MVEPFGEGTLAEVFKYSLFLVLCNRLTSCAVAICSLAVRALPPGCSSVLASLHISPSSPGYL